MNKKYMRFYILSIIGILLASYYPLYMGIKTIKDMNSYGYILRENYPKYIIPYTPICIAFLMALFFIVMGVTAGFFAGSFLLGKKKRISVILPSLVSGAVTLLMYIGEMILLSGHLYKFGHGIFFESLEAIVLAPVDVMIIMISIVVCGFILSLLNRKDGEQYE